MIFRFAGNYREGECSSASGTVAKRMRDVTGSREVVLKVYPLLLYILSFQQKYTCREQRINPKDIFSRGYAGPSSGDKNVRSHIPEGTKKPLLQGYLKHLWPLGWGSNMATKSLINVSSMNRSKESDPGEAAK